MVSSRLSLKPSQLLLGVKARKLEGVPWTKPQGLKVIILPPQLKSLIWCIEIAEHYGKHVQILISKK